tara:strand:+ start:302 stop:1603 length:1302 start_codon:yes stop_codon:yes gene_type:complete
MSIKINSLEIENVKRVKAVKLDLTGENLTIIGGNNANGKTSVIESIAWALGGNKYALEQREGSVGAKYLKVTMSNGVVVERAGKNSTLKVTDPSGNKAGQSLLNTFIEGFALDLPRFLNANDKDKAKTLLNIIGIEKELIVLDQKEDQLYNKRLAVGQVADRKKKHAEELPFFENVPEVPVEASELIQQQQAILAKNGANQKLRSDLKQIEQAASFQQSNLDLLMKQQEDLLFKIGEKAELVKTLEGQVATAEKSTEELQDENTDAIEAQLAQHEEINAKVRANLDKQKAEEDSEELTGEYNGITEDIETVRDDRIALLEGADMPLENLTVKEGKLFYHGQTWGNMSGAEQLMVATAIVRKLNPECGFVLLDKLEQMDQPTLKGFGEWLEKEGLQAIATRVSTGEECSIIIEDGLVVDQAAPQTNDWSKGEWK